MKKMISFSLIVLASIICKANTYVHYTTDYNIEWCQVYDDNGRWMGAYTIEWDEDNPLQGNVFVYNWSKDWRIITNPSDTTRDKHIYLKKAPKETITLDVALSAKG